MFGTKKIYAKVMNDKLVVRVGGGYMGIDEFINTYGESELLKLKKFTPQQIAELHQPTQSGPPRRQQQSPKQVTGEKA